MPSDIDGITIAYNRETLSESSGLCFCKAGKISWKTILKSSSEKIFVSVECVGVCIISPPRTYIDHLKTKGNNDYV